MKVEVHTKLCNECINSVHCMYKLEIILPKNATLHKYSQQYDQETLCQLFL
jgi:hypothetical protein